jgi:hypothetical protein
VNKGSSEERKEDFKNIRHNAFVRIPRKGVTRKIFRDLSYSKTAEIIRYPWKRSILSYLSGKSEEIRKIWPGCHKKRIRVNGSGQRRRKE